MKDMKFCGGREEIMQHAPKNSVTTSANQTYEMRSLHGSGACVPYAEESQ